MIFGRIAEKILHSLCKNQKQSLLVSLLGYILRNTVRKTNEENLWHCFSYFWLSLPVCCRTCVSTAMANYCSKCKQMIWYSNYELRTVSYNYNVILMIMKAMIIVSHAGQLDYFQISLLFLIGGNINYQSAAELAYETRSDTRSNVHT